VDVLLATGMASVLKISAPVTTFLFLPRPVRVPGAVVFFVRIGPIRFLAGCHKRRLNQG